MTRRPGWTVRREVWSCLVVAIVAAGLVILAAPAGAHSFLAPDKSRTGRAAVRPAG